MIELPNHPHQVFRLVLVGEPSESARDMINACVVGLENRRDWTIGPPSLIWETETDPDDGEDIVTLGMEVEMYSGWPPHKVPVDVDRLQYDECALLVESARQLTEDSAMEFDCYLENVWVGTISKGAIDESLRKGLFEEWQKNLT